MAKCQNCNAEIDENAKLCPFCNAKIAPLMPTLSIDGTTHYTAQPQDDIKDSYYVSEPPVNLGEQEGDRPECKTGKFKEPNGYATAGLVLSIISLLVCFLYLLALPALALSICGLIKSKNKNTSGKVFAIIGIVISVIVIIEWFIFIVFKGGNIDVLKYLIDYANS